MRDTDTIEFEEAEGLDAFPSESATEIFAAMLLASLPQSPHSDDLLHGLDPRRRAQVIVRLNQLLRPGLTP